jgi:Tfp pilus assembly protein PilN
VKAVNLIPLEERRGAAGGSGTPTYGVLGLLGLLVVAVTAWVVLSNQIGERKADLAREQNKAAAAQTRVESLKPYVAFADLSQKRVQTVTQLAQTRFDWKGTMHDLARVVGGNVWITDFTGTVAPGVEVGSTGGGGDTGQVRSALSDPAVELKGCATSNDEVARFVSRLRAMKGVTRVTIVGAAKSDTATPQSVPAAGAAPAGAPSAASSGSDCTEGSDRYPVFSLVIFFKALPGGTGAAPATGGAAPAATPTPATPSGPGAAPTSAPSGSAGTSSPASAGGSK